MAASTTLKLPERLKQRIAPLARSAGKTPHAWMVEALETHTALAEKRRTFVADALAAEKEVERTGRVYPAGEVHRYLRARVAGRKAKRPKPARW
jgi:predicted transcriptional regulator